MSRLHLVEFEDLSWFPKNIRNYMTDFLQFTANQFDFYKSIIPILKRGVNSSSENRIVDLASGGGGGWLTLCTHLKKEMPNTKVLLTDYYPNVTAFEHICSKQPKILSFEKGSIDAKDVDPKLKGLRTQFLSLHHFKPEDAKQILQNAVI